MDMDALVSEICRRVQEKIADLEGKPAERPEGARPKLLILTAEHGTSCHDMLENGRLLECYDTECALLADYRCRVEEYEAVIAYTMTNEALGKIAHGIFDSGYTRLFGEALLAGKKIFLAEEDVELYRSRQSAPKPYYGCLEANLELLKASGVVIAPQERIPELILHGEACTQTPSRDEEKGCGPKACGDEACAHRECGGQKQRPEHCGDEGVKGPQGGGSGSGRPEKAAVPEAPAEEAPVKEAAIVKKIITEKDMIALGNDKVQSVLVGERAILTDLAKEYAARHKITIRRRDISSEKREQGL